MKKIFYLAIPLLFTAACQDELYIKPLDEFVSNQGVYLDANSIQIFAEEGAEISVDKLKLGLARKEDQSYVVKMKYGAAEQLESYNKKMGSNYVMLPESMYEATSDITFAKSIAQINVPLKIKSLQFSAEGTYALPISIESSNTNIIEAQKQTILIIEPRIKTKVLRINGSGTNRGDLFADDFKVDQWTMEVMVNRSQYNSNNKSIGGTKLLSGTSNADEIFTRFGDVTIDPNQLQIKTGNSQIDIPKDKLSAEPNKWYMLSFVYDGKNTKVYVNGELAVSREIRTGKYSLKGFWIGGANELIREFRFYKVARTDKQIKDNVWKMVNPNDENLLAYYPMNGKKRDKNTGEITEDESKVWDWSPLENHLNKPNSSRYDDNNGDMYIFPLE